MTGERNEARLLVTMSSIGDAVIATDAEGRVTILNPVAQKMTGWSEEEAIGTPIGDVFITIDEHSRQPNPSPMAQVMATDGTAILPAQALLSPGTAAKFRLATAGRQSELPTADFLASSWFFAIPPPSARPSGSGPVRSNGSRRRGVRQRR